MQKHTTMWHTVGNGWDNNDERQTDSSAPESVTQCDEWHEIENDIVSRKANYQLRHFLHIFFLSMPVYVLQMIETLIAQQITEA